jgi:hypothetical protein
LHCAEDTTSCPQPAYYPIFEFMRADRMCVSASGTSLLKK